MQQFRTTVSIVFWTETPNESEGVVAALAALLPSEDQAATLSTIAYVEQGRNPLALTPAEPAQEEEAA